MFITLTQFFVALNFFCLMVTTSRYAIDRFGSSPSVAGLAASIFVVGGLATRLVIGKWLERIGRKNTLYIGLVVSLAMTLLFLVLCLVVIWWFFKTGYRLKN